MAIEIVDLPIENGGYFHSFLYVNQRVSMVFNGIYNHELNGIFHEISWDKRLKNRYSTISTSQCF
jgi:hypothetical protein